MAAPTKRSEQHSTANGTTSLALLQGGTTATNVAAGDLVLFWVGNVEATPNVSITVSGSATLDISTGTNVLTGGASGNAKIRVADTTNNLYGHIWAVRVISIGAASSITFAMDTSAGSFSTGNRRIGTLVINPNGNTFSSTTPTRKLSSNAAGLFGTGTTGAYTVPWDTDNALAGVGVVLGYVSSTKTYSVDFDNDGDYTANGSTTGAADAGDGGVTNPAVVLGGTGSGSNQAAIFGYGLWDTGGINSGSSDSAVGLNPSSNTGSKAFLIGYWSVDATATELPAAKGAEASNGKAPNGIHSAARLSGKGAEASGGKALMRVSLHVASKGAEVSDGKISNGFGRAKPLAAAKGPAASDGKAKLDPKQHLNPAKGPAASGGTAAIHQPAIDYLAGKGATASNGKAKLDPRQHFNAGKGANASNGVALMGHHVAVMPNGATLSNGPAYTATVTNAFVSFTATLSNPQRYTATLRNE